MPACPKLNFAIVDVRDVAAAHIKAMTVPEAAGMSACLSVGQYVCLLVHLCVFWFVCTCLSLYLHI